MFGRFFSNMWGGNATDQQVGVVQPMPTIALNNGDILITEDTALQLSIIQRSIQLVANAIGTCRIKVYEETPVGKKQIKNDLWDLIQNRPNHFQSGQEFRETLVLNLMLHGNFYARIVKSTRGKVIALYVEPSQHVQPELLSSGDLVFNVKSKGLYNKYETKVYQQSEIFHIKGLGAGIAGLNPLAYATQSIGLGVSGENFASKFFTSGGQISGLITTGNNNQFFTDEQRERLAAQVTGIKKGSGIMFAEGGLQFEAISMSPQNMEALASRKFSNETLARIYGVPLPLLGITELANARADKIEDIIRSWITTDLGALFTKIENGFSNQLMTRVERKTHTIEFDSKSLIKHDITTLMNVAEKGVRNGIMTQNESREFIDLPRIEDSAYDVLKQQAQMVTSDLNTNTESQEDDSNNKEVQ